MLGIASCRGNTGEWNYDRKREESEGLPEEMCRDRKLSSTADLPLETLWEERSGTISDSIESDRFKNSF